MCNSEFIVTLLTEHFILLERFIRSIILNDRFSATRPQKNKLVMICLCQGVVYSKSHLHSQSHHHVTSHGHHSILKEMSETGQLQSTVRFCRSMKNKASPNLNQFFATWLLTCGSCLHRLCKIWQLQAPVLKYHHANAWISASRAQFWKSPRHKEWQVSVQAETNHPKDPRIRTWAILSVKSP